MLTKTRRWTMFFLLGGILISGALAWWHSRGAVYQMDYLTDDTGMLVFLAAGRHGVVVLRPPTAQEPEFVPLAAFDTPGQALDISVQRQDGTAGKTFWIYVADGSWGLRVLKMDADNAIREVAAVPRPVWAGKNKAERVLAFDGQAFVAYGTAGVQVVDITNPQRPVNTGARVDVRGGYAYAIALDNNRLFIAAGDPGLLVYNVANPRDPALLGAHDPPQQVYDLALVGAESAYLAEGTGGIALVSLSNVASPVEIASRRDIGDVRHVTASTNQSGAWVFAATRGRGTEIFRFFSERVQKFETQTVLPKPGSPSQVVVPLQGDSLYILGGGDGLQTYTITSPKTPSRAAAYRTAQAGDGIRLFLGGVLLLFVGGIFWVAFFSQFALPVRTVGERWKAFVYLLVYIAGGHGPAIFIEDGRVRESRAESLRKGRGVILLDTASAAVLKTPGAFTRPVGPGVAFTKANERLAGVVDLHRQTQFIGPKGSAPVFGGRQSSESEEEYRARQQARDETSGLTRDGIEVVPNIIAVFKLYTEPEDLEKWHTRFGYRPESVWKAVVGEGINLDISAEALPEKRRMAWNWLPAYLAVDVWRECLRNFTLNELFERKFPAANDPDKMLTGMEIIMQEVADRFRSPSVRVLDGFGQYVRDEHGALVMKRSEEYHIVRNRGLQVYTIVITNLRLPEVVEKQLLGNWQKSWETQLANMGGAVERERIKVADEARMEAVREYALWTCPTLHRRLSNGRRPPEAPETLEIMLEDLRQRIGEELNLRRRMAGEWDDLAELLGWVRSRFNLDGLAD